MDLSVKTVTPPHYFFFFFNDTATTEIYTLSLHDALPISRVGEIDADLHRAALLVDGGVDEKSRSEEHTSELQSQSNLVCRLLLEKKKKVLPTRSAVGFLRRSFLMFLRFISRQH